MEEFDCAGVWWLPENESMRIGGTLRFSNDKGIELSLFGSLDERPFGLGGKVSVIHGLVWDCPQSGKVTLHDCFVQSYALGAATIARERYLVQRLFVGSHLTSSSEFSFVKAKISLSGLSSWASELTGLTHLNGRNGQSSFGIEWTTPQQVDWSEFEMWRVLTSLLLQGLHHNVDVGRLKRILRSNFSFDKRPRR